MRRKSKFIMILFVCMVAMLAGCGQSKKEPDDYATNNVKSEKTDSAKKTSEGIAKDKIKVGVVHLSDPAEGSGYTYTHELGIQGMQKNLGLSDEQIVRARTGSALAFISSRIFRALSRTVVSSNITKPPSGPGSKCIPTLLPSLKL